MTKQNTKFLIKFNEIPDNYYDTHLKFNNLLNIPFTHRLSLCCSIACLNKKLKIQEEFYINY